MASLAPAFAPKAMSIAGYVETLSNPRISELLKGRITKFSLDALFNHATLAGLNVKVKIAESCSVRDFAGLRPPTKKIKRL